MKNECIPNPTEENWREIAKGFETRVHFPHCIGAVDGKHIRVIKPYLSGSLFCNYKNYYSIILLAVADSNYSFVYVDIGAYGKDSDSNIFQNSSLWQGMIEKSLSIPTSEPFPGVSLAIPYVMVGDEAFALSSNVLRPYSGKMLSPKKRIFNYRLTLARRYVECTFGILSNKWRIFHRPIDISVDFADSIVKACCVLHNFVRARDGMRFEDTCQVEGFEDIALHDPTSSTSSPASVHIVHDTLADYFVSGLGSIP